MDFLNLVTAIHEHTNINIPESDYNKIFVLKDAVVYIRDALARLSQVISRPNTLTNPQLTKRQIEEISAYIASLRATKLGACSRRRLHPGSADL